MLDFEPASPNKRSGKRVLKGLFGIGLFGLLIALGSTFAANINLNNNQSVEFGQGVVQATACDEEVSITPYSNFVNLNGEGFQLTIIDAGPDAFRVTDASDLRVGMKFSSPSLGSNNVITVINPPVDGYYTVEFTGNTFIAPIDPETATFQGGGFYLSKITLAGIDSTDQSEGSPLGCRGKTFRIKALGISGATLGEYQISVGEDDFSSFSGNISDFSMSNPENSFVELSISDSSVKASDLYNLTIESIDQTAEQVSFACFFNCVFVKTLGTIREGSIVATSLYPEGLQVINISFGVLSSFAPNPYEDPLTCGLPNNGSLGEENLTPCSNFTAEDSGYFLTLSEAPYLHPQEMNLSVIGWSPITP